MGIRDTVRAIFSPERPVHPLVSANQIYDLQPAITTIQETVSATPETRAADPSRKFGPDSEESGFFVIARMADLGDKLPVWGDPRRDTELRDLAKQESILSGAFASMTQKMVSLGWTIKGSKNLVRRYSSLLYDANDGKGWSDYVAKLTQDFLSLDRGSFTELGRVSRESERVEAIWNIDGLMMLLRNDPNFPYWYHGPGDSRKVSSKDAFRIASLPGPGQQSAGLGFCAVSRAAKAAQLLITLYQYDMDKLSNMPPQGIMAVAGMTDRQLRDALEKYKVSLNQKNSLVYPGVLFLASMGGDLKVSSVPFATLPDSFTRQEVVQIYVYTLALDFGVDAREFWPAAIAGATRADALVQAMKAKGKGPGEAISVIERAVNTFVLPPGVDFKFDFQDDEEDSLKAEIDFTRAKMITELYGHSAQMVAGEGIIDRDEARELLGQMGILPRELMTHPEAIAGDAGGFRIRYHAGVLEEEDLTKTFSYSRNGHSKDDVDKLIADAFK